MHNCDDGSQITTCGLIVEDFNRTHGYTSLCRTCWPVDEPPREEPWTADTGNEGDVIQGRRESGK